MWQPLLIGFKQVIENGLTEYTPKTLTRRDAVLEMLDDVIIKAIEAGVGAGYPKDAGAVLLIELDGPRVEVEVEAERVAAICHARDALEVRVARDDAERALLWKGRKEAAGAVGRLTPNWLLQDAVVPRSKLPAIMREMQAIAARHRLTFANVFHAGDGNLHPLILYDANQPGELERTEAFGAEILELCLEVGGTITGEHGVGVEKINSMCVQFKPAELEAFHRVKHAFDGRGLLNPGKAVPTLTRCAEFGRMHVHRGQEKFPDLPRF